MSVIDHPRQASASRRNMRHFFTLRSSRNAKSSERSSIFNAFPNIETELSLADLDKSNGTGGRCLRIFCEKVKEGTYFKTISIKDTTTVSECIAALIHLIFEPPEQHRLVNPESLLMFEAVGRIKPSMETAGEMSARRPSVCTEFMEVSSRPLVPSQRVMEVFSLMIPASGLSRRLELRPKQPPARRSSASKSNRLSSETTYFGQDGTSSSPHSNGMDMPLDVNILHNKKPPPTLAHQPHLLLLKGSRPERDSLVHDLSPLFSGSRGKLSIGFSSKDDIRLYLAPGSNKSKSDTATASPLNLCIRDVGTRKSLYLVSPSQWKLPQTGDVIQVFHNWIEVSREIPLESYLQPGDILRFEAKGLAYIFLFKDASSVPEHELKLGFLSTPPATPPSASPISTPSSNRSALRTARISASRDAKTVDRHPAHHTPFSSSSTLNSKNSAGSCPPEGVFPSTDSVNPVLRMLFPNSGPGLATDDFVTFITPKPWTGLPNVTVASACYAHLTRSTATACAAARSSEKQLYLTLEHLLDTVGRTLTNEIDDLESVTMKHLVPAIWKVAFCFYISQYFSPGWLKPTLTPTEEPRDSWTLETPETETNGELMISPAEIESMSEVGKLRELSIEEADRTLDSAVQHTLGVILEDVTSLCQMVGNNHRAAENVKLAEQRLFDKLGQIRDNLLLGLSGTASDYPVALVQAEDYVDNQDNGSINDTSNRSATTASSDVDSASTSEDVADIATGRSSTTFGASAHCQRSSSDQSKSVVAKPPVPPTDRPNQMPTSSAQTFIEETFFRRLLHGISTHIIEQFLDNPKLNIDSSTGRQLLNFIRSLDTWMTNAGINRYKEPLRMIYQFAKLLSTDRNTLFQMRVQDMHRKFPEIPVPVLYFLVENYENGLGIRQAEVWQYDDIGTISYDDSPGESLAECTRIWKRDDRLKQREGRRGRVDQRYAGNKPLDLASLFHLAETKDIISKFDEELGKQECKFRWTRFLRHYPPPGLRSTTTTSNTIDSPNIYTARIRSREASTSRGNQELGFVGGSLPSNMVSKIARPTTLEFGSALLPVPIHSDGRPTRSIMGLRLPTYCASELGGTMDIRSAKNNLSSRYTQNPRSRAARLAGMYDLGSSSPYLAGDFTDSRPFMTRYQGAGRGGGGSLLGISRLPNRFASAVNLARSTEFDMVDGEEVRRVREEWSQFKRENSRPPSLSADDGVVKLRRPSQLPVETDFAFVQPFTPPVSQQMEKHRNSSVGHYPLMTESLHDFPYSRLQPPSNHLSRTQSGLSINIASSTTRPATLEVARSLRGSTSHLGMSYEFGRLGSQSSLLGVDASRTSESTIFNVMLQRQGNESFGINLVEGHRTSLDQPGIYITHVTPNSPADRSGKLTLGDRILAINGTDLNGLTYKESVALLKSSKERITLTIQKGSLDNPDALLELNS
uniref:PDZ domain-containing protein n=1 Tax=Schistocephalus solidus TaxID=70667 RepID=A0A0X3PT65_SCHSO